MPRNLRPRNPDAAVLSLLRRIESNSEDARRIDFYLYFQERENAVLAKHELAESGFSVTVEKSPTGSKWLCLASIEMIPEEAQLVSLRMRFNELVKRLHGEYDGWETQVIEPVKRRLRRLR